MQCSTWKNRWALGSDAKFLVILTYRQIPLLCELFSITKPQLP